MRQRVLIMILLCASVVAGCGKAKPTGDLIADLSSQNEGDRLKAVRWLQGRQGDATAVVPALMEALQDSHADIRWSAAIGLGYFGTKAAAALSALEKAQSDTDARVRNAARVAISRIRG
jgi:HEAT repeat protein